MRATDNRVQRIDIDEYGVPSVFGGVTICGDDKSDWFPGVADAVVGNNWLQIGHDCLFEGDAGWMIGM